MASKYYAANGLGRSSNVLEDDLANLESLYQDYRTLRHFQSETTSSVPASTSFEDSEDDSAVFLDSSSNSEAVNIPDRKVRFSLPEEGSAKAGPLTNFFSTQNYKDLHVAKSKKIFSMRIKKKNLFKTPPKVRIEIVMEEGSRGLTSTLRQKLEAVVFDQLIDSASALSVRSIDKLTTSIAKALSGSNSMSIAQRRKWSCSYRILDLGEEKAISVFNGKLSAYDCFYAVTISPLDARATPGLFQKFREGGQGQALMLMVHA